MDIIIIVAMAKNRVIGCPTGLPWRLPGDLRRFKRLTTDHTVIMGRKTFESLNNKPLPDRRNIVLSRNHQNVKAMLNSVNVASSLQDAIELAQRFGETETYIIGGGQVYAEALKLDIVDRIEMTEIPITCAGDVLFPEIKRTQWDFAASWAPRHTEGDEHPYSFTTWKRIVKSTKYKDGVEMATGVKTYG